jgi:hypothetical protein
MQLLQHYRIGFQNNDIVMDLSAAGSRRLRERYRWRDKAEEA